MKIYVTGAGIVSSLGTGKEETLRKLRREETGLKRIEQYFPNNNPSPVGVVDIDCCHELKTVALGIKAAREAISEAGLTARELKAAAFLNGTTVGGMDKTEANFKDVFTSSPSAEAMSRLKHNDCGYATEMIADALGPFRMVTTPSTACSSAANAIITGAMLIKVGMTDIVVAGGSETMTRFHVNGFNSLMILDSDPCRPFDRERNGISLGEGAGFIVLESEKSVKERGVTPLAELSGYGNRCDAFHQTATSADGEGPYLAMLEALASASLKPEEIDYINSHGTGTPNNDSAEMKAMLRIWGDRLPPFSSTKGFTGHTTSAAGAIEAVISILTLQHSFIPANIGIQNPMDGVPVPVKHTLEGMELRHVVNNSFAFGGNDSTLIFSKCPVL